MLFIDIHTHRFEPNKKNHFAINSLMAGKDVPQIPDIYLSAGIHPWQLPDHTEEHLEHLLKHDLARSNVIAIGEAGLDRAIGVPMELQMKVFEKQAVLAIEKGLPLIIHAVRSYPDLIQLKKRLPPEASWIIHGYQGKLQNAEQLLKHNIFLSFGAAILKAEGVVASVLSSCPLSMLFLETDNSAIGIEQVYQHAALLKNMPLDRFADEIQANFERLFPQRLGKII